MILPTAKRVKAIIDLCLPMPPACRWIVCQGRMPSALTIGWANNSGSTIMKMAIDLSILSLYRF